MDRIAIIGCGGSGKTILARQLGAALQAPVTHLDVVYYDDGWTPLPQEKFAALQEELVAQSRWVIDGNYASTLPIRLARATTVVFLDLPALTCLWGIAQRRWKHGGGQNDALGVYDRINLGFIKYVWNYRTTMAPRVRALIAEHAPHAEVHTVRSRRAAKRLLYQLTAQARPDS
ncbi:topology modulation protein [Spiractinospora alimapuensis]|uniref:topology modulation protein n=1 Tax=Spiractinospora alimapuensis TaxID=2820884 RepID=UPI001F3CAAB5|nr:topology modulation protein [Spiractinospora alimapuensis]QVQ53376.1 topology modulation protein [Spiractinospora alimapuensis]